MLGMVDELALKHGEVERALKGRSPRPRRALAERPSISRVIAPDVNAILYAFREDSERHAEITPGCRMP